MLKWEIIVSVHTYPPDNNLKKQNNTQISSGALGLGQWMKWRALGSSIFLQWVHIWASEGSSGQFSKPPSLS